MKFMFYYKRRSVLRLRQPGSSGPVTRDNFSPGGTGSVLLQEHADLQLGNKRETKLLSGFLLNLRVFMRICIFNSPLAQRAARCLRYTTQAPGSCSDTGPVTCSSFPECSCRNQAPLKHIHAAVFVSVCGCDAAAVSGGSFL